MLFSLYTELKALGIPMDSHESDLYVPLIPEVEEVLENTFQNRLRMKNLT